MQHKPRAEALSGVCTSNVRELYGVGLVTEALQSSRVRTHINSCRARRSLGDSSPPLTDVSLLRVEGSCTSGQPGGGSAARPGAGQRGDPAAFLVDGFSV